MPPRTRQSSTVARRGTSVQGSRVSYYSTPGQGQTLTTPAGQLGRVRQGGGNVYRVQTRSGQVVSGRVPARTYHRIVLAEFLATVLIIGAAPLVVPARQAPGADAAAAIATVSLAGPLVRLTAACIAFFVLALMASGQKSGKVAAAFGGLIVCGAAVNATEVWTALAKAFVPGITGGGTGQAGEEG